MNLRRWLTVGIGVKRWLVVAFIGLLVLAIGVAHVIRQVMAGVEPGGPVMSAIDLLTLQFLPYQLRGFIAGAAGLGLFLYGAYRLVRALVDPFALWDRDQPMVEVIYQKRFLARGPRIVAIGGGTGLSTLLRGLKEHTSNLTAVVTVADDGGSSGVLRTELGIPAVGDIRNCIVALADAEPLMGRLLQYRFPDSEGATAPAGEPDPSLPPIRGAEALSVGLGGHAVGNLLIAALVALEDGDFEEGIREMNRVLAVRGRVVPATGTVLSLHARLRDGTQVDGQSLIARSDGIDRVWVAPDDVRASEDAIRAIEEAEIVVIGPGSLYTSILPALLVPGVREAIEGSGALVVFACNVATQAGETGGYDLADHVDALERHGASSLPDLVLANNRFNASGPEDWLGEPVRLRWPPACAEKGGPRLVLDDLVDPVNAHRHDPARLAAAVIGAWDREGGHRRRQAVARVGRAS
ncbi:MAG TPA: gluconeogenesis factor YvcK family protein [Candidatus Limnocylindrales bacterium]|nr:gluconeogenesis factor YvcK family protein [Candidatus Limnocylindrales bacterium]